MFRFYEVGGFVRDQLLGVVSKDIDYVAVADPSITQATDTKVLFEILVQFLEMEKYRVYLKTPDMYTVRAQFPEHHSNFGITADFVLARKEIGFEEGTRKPYVVPGTLFDDLARRDFTMNAIARDNTGKIIDPFGGREDIKKKILRTPISGKITFEDDPLRLLRAIRFAVTKQMSISVEIHYILKWFDYEKKFHVVSEERIREELYKAFKADTLKTIRLLDEYPKLRDYCFSKTKLWLKPTNEK